MIRYWFGIRLRGEGRFFFSEDKKQKTFASDALKRDAISLNRFRLPHPALARCFHEHVYPAANRIRPDHALVVRVLLMSLEMALQGIGSNTKQDVLF